MADHPFDTTPAGFLEKPTSSDLNQNASQIYMTMREIIRIMCSDRSSDAASAATALDAFFGDSLRVVPSSPAAMSVTVRSGLGFLYSPADAPSEIGSPDIIGLDDLSPYKPAMLANSATFAVPTAPTSPNTRIDIIEVKVDRRLENSLARYQLDPTTKIFGPHSYFKTLAHILDGRTGTVTDPANSTAGLSYKVGTAGNPGVVPPTSPGYVKLAEINVSTALSAVTGLQIVDRRKLLAPGGSLRASVRFRTTYSAGVQTTTLLSHTAPPGVDVIVETSGASAAHSQVNVWCVGGQITKASAQSRCHPGTGTIANIVARMMSGTPIGGLGYANFLGTVSSTEQSNMNGASAAVAVPIGIGQQRAAIYIEAGHVNETTGVFSNADTTCDDVVYDVEFSLAYH